uniref:Uncharacterized protein n=1 Tax=Theropithecus gelada TaxID=9565 RepID=A0A8D2FMW3_THEGE
MSSWFGGPGSGLGHSMGQVGKNVTSFISHISNVLIQGKDKGEEFPNFQDQPGQHSKTPSLLKIQKLAVWWCMPVIPGTRESRGRRIA